MLPKRYFNHPFTNEKCIRLATDVDLDYTLSVRSLAADLESVNQEQVENEQTAQERLKVVKKTVGKQKATSILSMMDK